MMMMVVEVVVALATERLEKKKKNERVCWKHPHIHRRVDHRMSLLVATTFLPCSLFLDQSFKKEKKGRER